MHYTHLFYKFASQNLFEFSYLQRRRGSVLRCENKASVNNLPLLSLFKNEVPQQPVIIFNWLWYLRYVSDAYFGMSPKRGPDSPHIFIEFVTYFAMESVYQSVYIYSFMRASPGLHMCNLFEMKENMITRRRIFDTLDIIRSVYFNFCATIHCANSHAKC